MILVSDEEEATFCRVRAVHLRDVAKRMRAGQVRHVMLQAADSWEFLGELAAQRASKACVK